jgi:hypothetical protein
MIKLFILALNFLAINTMIFTQAAFADEGLASEISNFMELIRLQHSEDPQITVLITNQFVPKLKQLGESASSYVTELEAEALETYSKGLKEQMLKTIDTVIEKISNKTDYTLTTLFEDADSLLRELNHLHEVTTTDPLDL